MRRFIFLPLLLLALPAHAGVPETFGQWKRLRDPASDYVSFDEATSFLRAHPGWPQENAIRLKAEQAALFERPGAGTMQSFCEKYPPISGRGMIACLRAGHGDSATVKQAWKQGDFTEAEETAILSEYRSALTAKDHEGRIDRLLFEDKVAQAKRMLPRVTPQYRLLAEARIALINDARDTVAKVHGVPSALKSDPGLTFNRIQWRSRHGERDGVVELLVNGPKNPPYADKWWPYRANAIRNALEEGRTSDAMAILNKHGDLGAEYAADALFLKGWIRMEFEGNADAAYEHFYKLYSDVSTPVSKSRAAYWAGRAAKKNGNPDIARDWFSKGATYGTVFYGQLAQSELHAGKPLNLPDSPSPSPVDGELTRTAMWLAQQKDLVMANLFLTHATDSLDDPSKIAGLAKRANDNNYRHGAVKVAKQALRKNIVLVESGWPKVTVPAQSPIEPALALAITRQESEFNEKARSSADARGLMQVLPGTANHTAKRNGLSVSAQHLYEPQANMLIGTTYLGGLIDGWDGSYILAIASYNAGPANVRKWVARFGMPPNTPEGAINWIESIPFAETRNYVMRVLENTQVYRSRLKENTPLGITGDLIR